MFKCDRYAVFISVDFKIGTSHLRFKSLVFPTQNKIYIVVLASGKTECDLCAVIIESRPVDVDIVLCSTAGQIDFVTQFPIVRGDVFENDLFALNSDAVLFYRQNKIAAAQPEHTRDQRMFSHLLLIPLIVLLGSYG